MLCPDCPKYKSCKEICKEVEAILPKPQGGSRNKEKYYAPDVLESMANARAFRLKFGHRKAPHIEED